MCSFIQPLNKYVQVKSDIDHIFVVVCEIFYVLTCSSFASRAIFGPLPHPAVITIVEMIKLTTLFNLGILNFSHIVQFIIIYDLRYILKELPNPLFISPSSWIHQFKDKPITATAVGVGLLAYLPFLVEDIWVCHIFCV